MPRTDNGNLRSLGDISTDEQRKIASKGGKASVEARRRKKKLREELEILLQIMDEKSGKTLQEKMSMSLIEKAIHGDTKAYEVVRDTIGQRPDNMADTNIQQIIITGGDNIAD